ncbi:MAG: hypothetical protein ACK5H1_09200 [Tenacibaculum sp.]
MSHLTAKQRYIIQVMIQTRQVMIQIGYKRIEIAKAIGLISDKKVFKKFPNSELATVSVNLFKTS